MNVKTASVFIVIGLGLLFLIWEGQMNSSIPVGRPKNTNSAELEKNIRPVLKASLHSERPLIHLSDNQLSLAITHQPLQEVAKAIAQQAKLSILFDKDVPNPNIDILFSNLPIQQGLQRLFENYDTFFFYSNSNGTLAKLATIWVYPQGKGEILSPIPAVAIPSNPQLALNTNDPEPYQRASAVTLAIEHNGQDAEDVLQTALDDPEEIVRINALQAAIVSAIAMPMDRLNDLALHDPSTAVRSMAISSLFKEFEEGRIAPSDVARIVNLAQSDPEPMVSELAKQIIASLDEDPEESANSNQGDVEDPQHVANP
jgi:type II secretory pathway component GspD/PulD (secretin)